MKSAVFEHHTPIRIESTNQYNDRKAKFKTWLELSECKQSK